MLLHLGLLQRLHTKSYKFVQNVFPNIPRINYRTDLILGEAFCILIFFISQVLDSLY